MPHGEMNILLKFMFMTKGAKNIHGETNIQPNINPICIMQRWTFGPILILHGDTNFRLEIWYAFSLALFILICRAFSLNSPYSWRGEHLTQKCRIWAQFSQSLNCIFNIFDIKNIITTHLIDFNASLRKNWLFRLEKRRIKYLKCNRHFFLQWLFWMVFPLWWSTEKISNAF